MPSSQIMFDKLSTALVQLAQDTEGPILREWKVHNQIKLWIMIKNLTTLFSYKELKKMEANFGN
jgi:hypothetical protein